MPFQDLLVADRIVILVDPVSRDLVLDAAARLLAGGLGQRTESIARGLRERERIATTAIGHGVALPHCRNNAYAQARGVFLRLEYPVDFSARDGEPVDLVFAMSAPKHGDQRHLQIMSALAERFSDPQLRETIREARDLRTIREALMSPSDATIWNVAKT